MHSELSLLTDEASTPAVLAVASASTFSSTGRPVLPFSTRPTDPRSWLVQFGRRGNGSEEPRELIGLPCRVILFT